MLARLIDEFQRKHDSPLGWAIILAADWAIAALCVVLHIMLTHLWPPRNKIDALVSRWFWGLAAVHFFMLPVASFTRIWQLRLMTDLAFLAVFMVFAWMVRALLRERGREPS